MGLKGGKCGMKLAEGEVSIYRYGVLWLARYLAPAACIKPIEWRGGTRFVSRTMDIKRPPGCNSSIAIPRTMATILRMVHRHTELRYGNNMLCSRTERSRRGKCEVEMVWPGLGPGRRQLFVHHCASVRAVDAVAAR